MKFPPYLVLQQSSDDSSQTMKIKIDLPASLDYFDGHFHELAILPAVAQLFMVKKLAVKYFQLNPVFNGFKQLKFKSLIRPEFELELQMSYLPEIGKLKFEYHASGLLKSHGEFHFSKDAN